MDAELDFTGRTMLVTGSGRNIGRAIVLEFAKRGANVVINARSNVGEAQAVQAEAESLGARAIVVMHAERRCDALAASAHTRGAIEKQVPTR